jgi:hypothetical protein
MLSDDKRADMLARIGPVLAVTMAETTGQGWIFVPQDAADFAILSRREDGMQIGMLPGWFEHSMRFEFAPFIRIDGVAHTLTSLGLVPPGARALRIHVTVTRGVDALAADILRRVVRPYEGCFDAVRARIREATTSTCFPMSRGSDCRCACRVVATSSSVKPTLRRSR